MIVLMQTVLRTPATAELLCLSIKVLYTTAGVRYRTHKIPPAIRRYTPISNLAEILISQKTFTETIAKATSLAAAQVINSVSAAT